MIFAVIKNSSSFKNPPFVSIAGVDLVCFRVADIVLTLINVDDSSNDTEVLKRFISIKNRKLKICSWFENSPVSHVFRSGGRFHI